MKFIYTKNGKSYEVTERSKHWLIVLTSGAITINFQVSKEICATSEELKKYMETEKVF